MKRHLPNLITCLNLLTGAAGCIIVLRGGEELAIYFVLIAGVFDFFDGLTARLLHVSSPIGKELDSLADVISFGLLPALFMFVSIEKGGNSFLVYAALAVLVFSALRLAKFNTDENQSDRFMGVPTPANAIMLTSIVFLPDSIEPNQVVLVFLSLIASFLLVAPIPMIALKFRGTSWSSNASKYILVFLSFLLLAAFQQEALPFIVPLYIVISLIGNHQNKKDVSDQQ